MPISPAECRIMETLWASGETTAEAIAAEAARTQGWTAGTVKTLITRLLRKGAIEGFRRDRRYYYRALVSRTDYVQTESQSLIDRLFNGEVAPLVAHFAETRALSERDIRLLKQLVERLGDE